MQMTAWEGGFWVIVAFSGTLLAGCGGGGDVNQTETTEKIGESQQWIELGEGAGVELEADFRMCGKWERKTVGGTETTPEYYSFERLNAQLADDARLRGKVAELGISQVDSCKSARTVSKVRNELGKTAPTDAKAATDISDAVDGPETGLSESYEQGLAEAGGEGRVDKIGSSVDIGHKPTVYLGIWFGNGYVNCQTCTGTLISPNEILTSASCAVVDNDRPLSVRYWDGTCLHGVCGATGNAICNTKPAVKTGRTHFYPGYSGTGDWAENMGVIVMNNNHPAPANTSASWMRIAKMKVWDYWIRGWGTNSESGANSGVSRRSVQKVRASEPPDDDRILRTFVMDHGVGTACVGDGGGPALTHDWFSEGAVVGVFAGFTGTASCPRLFDEFFYTATWAKKDWIEEQVGDCAEFVADPPTPGDGHGHLPYMRCW
jgi:hypothetical protein